MTLILTPLPYPSTQVVTSRNLLPNPATTSFTGWTSNAGAGGTATTVSQNIGIMYGADGSVVPTTWRLAHTQTVGATSPGGWYTSTAVGSITPGATYTGSCYVTGSPVPLNVVVRMTWRNAAGAAVGSPAVSPVVAAGLGVDGYKRAAVTAVAPAGASYVTLEIYTAGNIAAGTVLPITAAAVTPGPLAPYFDGYTPAKVGVVYAWAGTPHNSESTETTRTPTAAAGSLTLESGTAPVTLVTDLPEDRANPVTLHQVIGRPDPLPALAPVRTRTGTMQVWCDSYTRARSIVDLYVRSRGLMMVRDPANPARDMYHVATSVPLVTASEDKRRWQVSVPYAEVFANAAAGVW